MTSPAETRLLFVCDGNTCRSPFAASLARRHEIEAASAGLRATPGAPATPQGVRAAARFGVDLSGHQSMAVAEPAIADVDIVLTMTNRQAVLLRAAWPSHAGKVERLDPDGDIEDPFGGSDADYAASYAHISVALDARFVHG